MTKDISINEAERFLQRYEQKKNEPLPIPPTPPLHQSAHYAYNQPAHSATPASDGVASTGIFDNWWSLSGRIGRGLYFQRFLVIMGVSALFGLVMGFIGAAPLLPACGVLVVPFTIPQHTRRLHDIGMSGWWQIINHIPVIGWILWLFLFVKEGSPGPNQYDLINPQEVSR